MEKYRLVMCIVIAAVVAQARVTAIAPSAHPNLYFNGSEIAALRLAIGNGSAPQYAKEAWSKVKGAKAVGKPSGLTNSMNWKDCYLKCQPRSKTNMNACMSYLIEPTADKRNALKSALMSWTVLGVDGENWAMGAQRGGHMQYPLAWMYDLIYNDGVLSSSDKDKVDAFMQKYAAKNLRPTGTGARLVHMEGSAREGYDNFYTLEYSAGLIMALVSHDQTNVDRTFISSIPDNYYREDLSAYASGDLRTFRNLINGEVFPSGYTYDGYKRGYGWTYHQEPNDPPTPIPSPVPDKGEGQHYHFFSVMGMIAAAEAVSHNGFDAWSYSNNLLVRAFKKGKPWAGTAYNGLNSNNYNHLPMYWVLYRRYSSDSDIRSGTSQGASKNTYSYFWADVGRLWGALADIGSTVGVDTQPLRILQRTPAATEPRLRHDLLGRAMASPSQAHASMVVLSPEKGSTVHMVLRSVR